MFMSSRYPHLFSMPSNRGTSRRAGHPGHRRFVVAVLGVLLAAVAGQVRAQPVGQPQPVTTFGLTADLRRAEARQVDVPPQVDGEVLGDPVWRGIEAATGFVQTAPDEGLAASERTEVRVVFTDDTIYFGIVCYDRDPSSIIVTDSRRDS